MSFGVQFQSHASAMDFTYLLMELNLQVFHIRSSYYLSDF